MQQKIVITGAPGTGKTSVIHKLEEAGIFCHHEVIRSLTLEAKKEGNQDTFSSNPLGFVSDPFDFNKKILKGRIDQFQTKVKTDKPIIFFDRAIPDVLAYMDFFGQEYDDNFTDACEANVYDKVFLLPPWKDIYITDNERFETFDEALQIHKHLENTYKRFGYSPIEVPVGKIGSRADYILKELKY